MVIQELLRDYLKVESRFQLGNVFLIRGNINSLWGNVNHGFSILIYET